MDASTESWKDVPGYEGRYQVSDHGNVRSVDWICTRSNGRTYTNRSKVLTQSTSSSGHKVATLIVKNKQHRAMVHRLVLEAFVGPCPPGMETCHADDNPSNNHLSNLRWDSRRENMLDRVRNGIHHYGSSTYCKRGHGFTDDNTYRTSARPNARWCRKCKEIHDRKYRASKKQVAA